jgi:phenylacetate-CoA ligase
VQPIVFHRVMDTVPSSGWQVVQGPEELTVLLSGEREGFADGSLIDSMKRESYQHKGRSCWRVQSIPRTALGKAPLIKANC